MSQKSENLNQSAFFNTSKPPTYHEQLYQHKLQTLESEISELTTSNTKLRTALTQQSEKFKNFKNKSNTSITLNLSKNKLITKLYSDTMNYFQMDPNISKHINIDTIEGMNSFQTNWNKNLTNAYKANQIQTQFINDNLKSLQIKTYSQVQPSFTNKDDDLINHINNEIDTTINDNNPVSDANFTIHDLDINISDIHHHSNLINTFDNPIRTNRSNQNQIKSTTNSVLSHYNLRSFTNENNQIANDINMIQLHHIESDKFLILRCLLQIYPSQCQH